MPNHITAPLTERARAPKTKGEPGWAPKTKADLQSAIVECLQRSDWDCSKGSHGPIGSWDVWDMTSMMYLFFDTNGYPNNEPFPGAGNFNGDLSKWDVSRVANMHGMFYCMSSLNCDISEWDVSKVIDMQRMFVYAKSFNSDISEWDVSKVTNMQRLFSSATSFNGDISKWDVSRVNAMNHMFAEATSFNSDLSKWDVAKVTNMDLMFFAASSFRQTLCGAWPTSTASKFQMFDGSSGRLCTTSTVTSATMRTTTSTSKTPSIETLSLHSDSL